MEYLLTLTTIFLFGWACTSIVVDPSPNAVASNDYTLAMSICHAAPGLGVDVCRAKEGSPISSEWVVALPDGHNGGQAVVQYRDVTLSYGIENGQTQLNIPLKDLMGHATWSKDDSGTSVLFVNLLFDGGTGTMTSKARGFAFFIITSNDYDPLPINSPYGVGQVDCKIQYSTSGRSAIDCK